MPDGKLVYAGAVEALFLRALENRLTPACRQVLRESGLDLDRKLEPAYSLEQWKQFLRITASHLYGGMPAEAAYYELGERFMEGFFSSALIGRALLSVVRLVGPRRMLQRVHLGFRASTSFTQVSLVPHGDMALELRVNEVSADQPTFLAGALARAVQYAGGHQPVVLPEQFDGQFCTFRIHWYEPDEADVRERRHRRRRAARERLLTPRPPA